jgi:hypothetical protein
MKFKDIIIQHKNGNLEIKETVQINTIGFESVLNSGRKITPSLLTALYKKPIEALLDSEIKKPTPLDIWELSI